MTDFKILSKQKEVESHPFHLKLLSGDITDERYAFYLWEQSYRYGAIEDWMEDTSVFDGIESIKRYHYVRDDFKELWKKKLGKKYMPQPSWSATDLAKRLKEIKEDDIEDTMQGLAYIYTMHGDLLKLARKVDLNKLPGSNKMFQFDSSVDELLVKLEAKITDTMTDEILKAYNLKIRMFNYLNDMDISKMMHDNKEDIF